MNMHFGQRLTASEKVIKSMTISAFLARTREFLDAFANVSMCASVLMTVALSFERHFAIRFPNEVRNLYRIKLFM